MHKSANKYASKVKSSPAARARTTEQTKHEETLGKKIEDIIEKKIEDILEKKLVNDKLQNIVDGGETSAAEQIKDADVEIADVPSSKKTLFMGNLSFSIREGDIIDFFKDVGEVVEVRLAMKYDRFAGYGHVEFFTPDAARKALELNGEILLERAVRLELAKEKVAYTIGNGNEPKTANKNDDDLVDAPSSKIAPQTPTTLQSTGSKIVFVGNLNYSVQENDILNFFKDVGEVVKIRWGFRNDRFVGFTHVEFATHEAAQKALKLDGEILFNRAVKLGLAKERDAKTSTNGDEPQTAKKNDADDALSPKKADPQTSGTPQAIGSKTLFMGNLSFSIKESDIIDFFKDIGEVVEVRLAMRDDRFAGYGHVEFFTPDAAQKALELNGELLLERAVRLELAKEKGAYTIGNGNEPKTANKNDANADMVDAPSSKKLPQIPTTPQATGSKTLFVGNLSFSVKESDILNFFKDSGEVVEVRLAMRDDRFAGYGHVEFATPDAAQKALELNGELLLERAVRLDLAKEKFVNTSSNGELNSANKSAFKVNSYPADVAQTTNPINKGKRNAEEIIEQKIADIIENKLLMDNKRQKIVKNGVSPASLKMKAVKQESISQESEEQEKEELNKTVVMTNNCTDAAKNDEAESNVNNSLNEPQTSATLQSTGSKTLFVGNLSYSVKESDILDFFKDVGEVVNVRWGLIDDHFAGFMHVDFATSDTAQKAFKLNGEKILDQAVRLDFAKERVANTPSKCDEPQTANKNALELNGETLLDRNVKLELATGRGANTSSNGNAMSSQKSQQSQTLTVYVKGFGTDDGFDSIRSALEEHFGQCGEYSRMAIPKDFESGGPKGVAFIDFTDITAFNKALELGGSEVNGGIITVEEAKHIGSSGVGFGVGRSGGRHGGRNGGRGRSGGRGRGRGRGRGF